MRFSLIFKSFFTSQFLLFVVVGSVAATANFFVRILLSQWMPFISAVVIAYFSGMFIAYYLFRTYVFKVANQGDLVFEKFKFFTVNILAVWQTALISSLYLKFLELAGAENYKEEFAHLVGMAFPVFTSFAGHKFITFANNSPATENCSAQFK